MPHTESGGWPAVGIDRQLRPKLNEADPLLLYLQVTTFPFGWAMLRFKADNPGVWPLHCHIEVTE